MWSCSPSRRASAADSSISRVVTEKGEHGATAICDERSVRERVQPLGVGEDRVDVLDERVRRQPAVRLAEVHRAARGDEADAELLRGAHLGLDEARDAAREDVVVVEDRRAARQRQLGQPAACGGVLHLVVDARPAWIERLQPREEIGLLCARARQGLVQVMMRVDEAGRDDCAAEILGARGRLARADLGDQPVLDPDPAVAMLGAGVVHRDEPAVAEDHAASSGTSSNAVDVDEAAVGQLQRGNHRQREERHQLERRLDACSRAARPPRRRHASARRPPRAARR